MQSIFIAFEYWFSDIYSCLTRLLLLLNLNRVRTCQSKIMTIFGDISEVHNNERTVQTVIIVELIILRN